MKNAKIVYVPIEIKARGLVGRILLATELASRGYTVVLGTHYLVRDMAVKGAKGILIDKDLEEARCDVFKKIHNKGGRVFAWYEEFVFPKNCEFIGPIIGISTVDEIDGVFLWGENNKEIYEPIIDSVRNKLFVVGSPRIDVLGNNLSKMYGINAKAKYGRYILVCSSAGINPRKDNKKLFEEMACESDPEKNGYNYFNDLNRIKEEVTWKLVECVKKLASEIDITIIFRAHPDEDETLWEKAFEGYSNVIATTEGYANDWITEAELMIHCGCTTALEAYMSGVKSILYNPIVNEKYYTEFPNILSTEVADYDSLHREVIKIINGSDGEFFTEEKNRVVSEYIYARDDELCVKRVANVVDEYSDGMETAYKFKIHRKSNFINEFIIFMNRFKYVRRSKFPNTTTKEVRKYIEKSCNVLNIKKRVKCTKLYPNIFMLEK